MKKKSVHVISHTHWDREWYLRKETFLMMLVELVDDLIDILKKDENFTVFMLDGQTIALEDYLSVRPGQKDILQKFIKEGRILIGPWYVLPDEYLISGEGHIRNYLIGNIICSEMGAKMDIGYLPDSFGHPSQIPQILKGLGLKQIVFWRGLSDDITETELIWEGLDGTEIIGINMPLGYGPAACLPTDKEEFIERMKSIINRLEPLTRTNSILVMQGTDHVAPTPELPKLLEYAREELPEYSFEHSTLQSYFDSIPLDIISQRVKGELRSGYRAYLLGGTLSTRMYIKQENFYRERELIKYTEPMQVIASAFSGKDYPHDLLVHAWKLYLQNMPHDSICGCSIDEVHDEMMLRYKDLAAVSKHLMEHSVDSIITSLSSPLEEADGSVLVFNPLAQNLTHKPVRINLVYEKNLIRKVNYATSVLEENYPKLEKKDPLGITFLSPSGKEISGRIVNTTVNNQAMDISLDTQPQMFLEKEIEVEFSVDSMPSMGFSVFGYRWEYEKQSAGILTSSSLIENKFLSLETDTENSLLLIRDKRITSFEPFSLTFVDTGDEGDEYTYSAPEFDSQISWTIEKSNAFSTPTASILKVDGYIDLPESLSEDRRSRSTEVKRCPLVVTAILHENSKRIEFSVDFENRSFDHRLRLQIFSNRKCTHSYAETLFGIDTKDMTTNENRSYEDWVEPPSTNSHKTFVALTYDGGAMCLANHGLPEFETGNADDGDSFIALTLLRSVGWLSRFDLRDRKGNGGWTLETPGAQCLGEHIFDFALIVQSGELDLPELVTESHAFAYPLVGWQADSKNIGNNGPSSYSFCNVSSPAIIISALKRSENKDGWIMRLYNSTEQHVSSEVSFASTITSASRVDLQERDLEKLELHDTNVVNLSFAPWQIQTISIKLD